MKPHRPAPAAGARLLAGLLVVLVLGAALPLRAAQEIRLGEINPLSGHLAKHGMEIHQGILYAVEEANAQGGVAGHPVKLLSRDDQSKPEVAVNQAQDLIFRGKVTGLVGGYVDSLVGPISQQATGIECRISLRPACSRRSRRRKTPTSFGFPAWKALCSRCANFSRPP